MGTMAHRVREVEGGCEVKMPWADEISAQDVNAACSVYDTLKITFTLCGYFLTYKKEGDCTQHELPF